MLLEWDFMGFKRRFCTTLRLELRIRIVWLSLENSLPIHICAVEFCSYQDNPLVRIQCVSFLGKTEEVW